jgi:hypothetical protein
VNVEPEAEYPWIVRAVATALLIALDVFVLTCVGLTLVQSIRALWGLL